MRIVIDMQGAQSESRFRGIGRYTLAIAQAIVRNRGEHEVVLALSGLFPETIEPIRAAFEGLMSQRDIRVWYAVGPVQEVDPENDVRRMTAELIREAFLESLQPDIVLVTSLFEGLGDESVTSIGKKSTAPTAVILYDLIPMLRPEEHLGGSERHRSHYFGKLEHLKKSALLLAISESARREALDAMPGQLQRIVSISGACDASFRVLQLSSDQRSSVAAKFGINKPFVMYTGGADERKNLLRLVQSFGSLPPAVRDSHQMVFAGKMPAFQVAALKRTASAQGLKSNDLVFTGYVSNEDLIQLYNTCKAFVFPSLHEGLGLPPLEAMACGAPTIAANATSLPEIVGLSEALFDPQSVPDMVKLLDRVLTDEPFRATLVKHGLQQVLNFSWDRSAKLALEAMTETLQDLMVHRPSTRRSQEDIIRNLLEDVSQQLKDQRKPDDNWLLNLSQCMADNEMLPREPQLLLDVSVIVHGDAKSGIQRVVRSLLNEILLRPQPGWRVAPIYFDGAVYRLAEHLLPSERQVESGAAQPAIAIASGDIYLSLDLNIHTAEALHPLLKHLRARGVSMNFLVYDLLLETNPEWWNDPIPRQFTTWLGSISELADRLICISAAVADELKGWLARHPPQRARGTPSVLSFHLGADIENSVPSKGLPSDAETQLMAMRQHPSMLAVGTIEPRKGQTQLLDAMERLWAKGIDVNLVLVGKNGWKVETLVKRLRSHPELNRRLYWLEGISDEYLEKVYGSCSCLVAASLGEGFGLPLIEAAQKNLPILARDLPVFREVAGNFASYFHGTDPADLSQAIETWLNRFASGEHIRSEGMHWLTWKESAEALKALLPLTDPFPKN